MLGYTVSLLFTSIQIKYVYFLKMLLVLRNYNICNYMPEISLGTEVFTLPVFKAYQPKGKQKQYPLPGWPAVCGQHQDEDILFKWLGINIGETYFHLRETKELTIY